MSIEINSNMPVAIIAPSNEKEPVQLDSDSGDFKSIKIEPDSKDDSEVRLDGDGGEIETDDIFIEDDIDKVMHRFRFVRFVLVVF